MTFAKHEFPEGVWCKWCGAMNHPSMTATCLQRAIPKNEMMPEPKRREFAANDIETIAARIAELRAEQDALRGEPIIPEIPEHMDYGDCCT